MSAIRELYGANDWGEEKSRTEDIIHRFFQAIWPSLSAGDKFVMRRWLQELQTISRKPARHRIVEAIQVTIRLGVHRILIGALLRHVSDELIDDLWKNRSSAFRLMLLGAITGLVTQQDKAAGLAIFGTAIGIPLWLVFASGGATIGALLDAIAAF